MDIDVHTARVGFLVSVALLLPSAIIWQTTDSKLFFVLTVLCVCAMLFFSFFNRCPNCGRIFGRFSFFAEYCPYCGEHL